jgi:hypothetical protein
LKLQRATEAGDDPAVQYFQGQINKGLEMETQANKGSILSPLAQGATLGFSDEIAGGAAGLTEMLKGGSFSEGYDPVVKDFREANKAYGERNPVVSTAAEIGGGLALPFGAIRSVGTGLRAALGSGALYGAGTAEGGIEDRLKGAGAGAAAGGAGYGVLRGAGALTRGLFGRGSQKSRNPGFRGQVNTLRNAGIRVNAPEELADQNTRQSYEALARTFYRDDRRPQQLYSNLMRRVSGSGYGFTPADARLGELSRDAVDRARTRFSRSYDRVLDNVNVTPHNWWRRFLPVEQQFD